MIAAAALAVVALVAPGSAQVAQSHKLESGATARAREQQVALSHELEVGARLVAAGDVASCRSRGDEATASVVARLPGTVAVLGDSVYERGTPTEFARCYAPSWGRFRGRTRPAVGNHEYGTPGAAGYFRYFGRAAGDPRRGYYAYRLGAWQVVVLNTNCAQAGGCGARSPQEQWLRGVLSASTARCTVAYGHHPRFSSGIHGPDASIDPLWRALKEYRVELYLAGHDHHYERFRPVDGLRQFVVGTGGRSVYPFVRRVEGSERRWWGGFGVLALRLLPDSYDWRFVAAGGSRFADSGSAACA
ncbi:MAG TPA: metallophosphoesterase [Gaiellaceae bacterium]|nr:metallophosphoesterase [Gaiellaceae bacterium]